MNSSLASPEGMLGRSTVPRMRAIYLALGMAAVATLAYVLLRQDTTHQYDIYWMLPRLRDGLTDYPRHPFALPFLDGMVGLLDGFGSLHERFKLANAICVGLAVGIFTHAAFLLCSSLRTAALIGITYAALPATVRFATIAELHGLFLPFAAVAIWLVGRLVTTPARRRAWSTITLGVTTAIAAGFHGTGHLLVGVGGVWLVIEWRHAEQGTRKTIAAMLALVGAHLATSQLITWAVLVNGSTTPVDAQLELFDYQPHTTDGMGTMLYRELLWPLLPVSLLWPIGLFSAYRRLAAVFALCVPAYLATCQTLLCVPELGYTFHEDGAYLMPLAFLPVVLSVRLLPGRWVLALPVVAIAATCHAIPNANLQIARLGRRQLRS